MEIGRMRLRSSISIEERKAKAEEAKKLKQEAENRPPLKYKGKIVYTTTFVDCAQICDKLLGLIGKGGDDLLIVGFDLEWPFSWQTGPGKTALIQISPNLDISYLIHVSEIKNLPKGLADFLAHPKVRITGVNIKNDVRKLCRDFGGFDVERIIQNCIDCGVLANTILPITQRWSMDKLVDYVLKMKIDKDKKVRMSQWHIIPLKRKQILYAATDSYASLLLYQKIKELEQEMKMTMENP